MGKKDFAFGKENFIWVGLSVALIIIGFVLMVCEPTTDKAFNPDIFDMQRITIAPITTLSGFLLMIFAIFKKSKE